MRYDYNELMHKSLLFVQSQRSGRQTNVSDSDYLIDFDLFLIQNKYDLQAIPWRGDSGLKDGCLEGVNLEGKSLLSQVVVAFLCTTVTRGSLRTFEG